MLELCSFLDICLCELFFSYLSKLNDFTAVKFPNKCTLSFVFKMFPGTKMRKVNVFEVGRDI